MGWNKDPQTHLRAGAATDMLIRASRQEVVASSRAADGYCRPPFGHLLLRSIQDASAIVGSVYTAESKSHLTRIFCGLWGTDAELMLSLQEIRWTPSPPPNG